ncbi:MAG: hypothetical protein U0R70_05265 [Solirubrobacteraceae bacterium]
MAVWDAVVWLHVIAMAFFVGGQLFLAAVVVPVERADPSRERLKAMARRFGWGTLIAIAVLLATGAAMASHFHLWSEPKLHLKLGLVAATAVLVVWHMRKPTWHALEAAIFLLSLAIVWIGLTL